MSRLVLIGAGLVALLPAASFADNVTLATASQYVVGQGWATLSSNGGNGRFYRFGVVPGRSYCAETAAADFNTDGVDTVISVFDTAGAPFTGNDDNHAEPSDANGMAGASRACWIAATGETDESLNVSEFGSGVGIARRFRVSDTSLWAPWFFSGSGFEAFILIKNTTAQVQNVAVSLFSTNGLQNGATQSAAIPANGSLNYQVSAAPFSLTSATGSVQISHTGAPGALVASVTSLSFGQGVSFDVSASPRQDFLR